MEAIKDDRVRTGQAKDRALRHQEMEPDSARRNSYRDCWAASALFAYSARPEAKAVIIVAAVPTVTPVPYSPSGPDRSLPAAYAKPLVVPLGPRVASTASLHLGPGAEYAVLGTLQAGAHLEVVGRDESAEWLAIVFPPNSTLRAWLPASQALGVPDVEGLPIEPVRLLP
jgi:hypothetical protein